MKHKSAAVITMITLIVLVVGGLGVLFRFVKPLITVPSIHVIYSEGEDFKSDAIVYKRLFRRNFIFIHFPNSRTSPKWWGVDLNNMSIFALNPPRRMLSVYYVRRKDPLGTSIDQIPNARDWNWQFTERTASFSGNAFSCKVRW